MMRLFLKGVTIVGAGILALAAVGLVVLLNIAFYDQVVGQPVLEMLRWMGLSFILLIALTTLGLLVQRVAQKRKKDTT